MIISLLPDDVGFDARHYNMSFAVSSKDLDARGRVEILYMGLHGRRVTTGLVKLARAYYLLREAGYGTIKGACEGSTAFVRRLEKKH